MNRARQVDILETLASGIRLDVYRLLIKGGPGGLVAGGIASALELPPANLSFHLKAMGQTGIVTVDQEGRFHRYRGNMQLIRELVEYLTAKCRGGYPERCAPAVARGQCARRRTRNRYEAA